MLDVVQFNYKPDDWLLCTCLLPGLLCVVCLRRRRQPHLQPHIEVVTSVGITSQSYPVLRRVPASGRVTRKLCWMSPAVVPTV